MPPIVDLTAPAISGAAPEPELRTLIDDLLSEQKKPLQTPVARFSDYHDREPDLKAHYRNLIPLSLPGEGEQYAFEVSLDRCTACKSCVAACHSLNGLDDDEAWRDIGTLVGGRAEPKWKQTVTTACHHCAEPGCLSGCPVGAYEKDRTTGVVRHLDDQCIGCSYCLLKCPYDVPKYSKKRGIVRKCDMCHGRLAAGEAPACVQACPTGAIRIVNRKVSKIVLEGLSGVGFLTGAPTPATTLPATRYVGREVPVTAHAADQESLALQHTHLPLVLMLTLTQAGLGLLIAAAFLKSTPVALAGAGVFFAGMAASVLHLGRPLGAWRFFLGLRTSWLSREILAFSMVAPLAMLIPAAPFLTRFIPIQLAALADKFLATLPPALAVLSLVAVFTSVMIYVDTHRTTWRFSITAKRFFGTLIVFAGLGLTIALPTAITAVIAAAAILLKLATEARFLRDHQDPDAEWTPDHHTARLMRLRSMTAFTNGRFAAALGAVATVGYNPWLAAALMLLAELLERAIFFRTVHAPKMPGSPGRCGSH
ncbi:MAG: molybdopterin oxidoreductase [Akkermansiaceae bacterium]|nr:molybdopterin oxidoreductase [Akkermansiaceae bacterium]